jgi:peptide/nickel transport system substrate-binding protein
VYQWDSEPAIRLLDTLTQTFGEDERQQLYDALHRQMIDEVPIIGLYNAHAATALGKDVRDFQPWPLNLPRLWGVWKADDAG